VDGLTPAQWAAIGPVLNNYALRLDAIVESGTYVPDTAKGFLFHLMTDVGVALTTYERECQEDEAWDEKERRDADEASEDAYDEYERELDGRMG
jgi:hypothetical protein